MKLFMAIAGELDCDLNDCVMQNMECICEQSNGRLLPHHFTGWDAPMGKYMGMTDIEAQRWAYEDPAMQLCAIPHDGAKEALEMLRAAGIKINIVTASCMSEGQIASWLNEWEIPFDRIVKTSVKMGGNLLIDDSLATAEKRHKAGLPTLVFSQLWNKGAPGERLDHWAHLITKVNFQQA